MRQMPLIISHFTVGTGYEQEVQNLVNSLDAWNLDNEILGIKSLGTWRENSNYCAKHVMDMMKAHPDRDILRVDADAVFEQYPIHFIQDGFSADVAATVMDFRWHHNELLGGTLFFKNTVDVRILVYHWHETICIKQKQKRPGDALQELLASGDYNNIRFEELPPQYCQIFDIMKSCGKPVIQHNQASRRFKSQINLQRKKARL